MIILKTRDVVVDDAAIESLQEEFQRRSCVRLTGLLDASLLTLLMPIINSGSWRSLTHEGIGSEIVFSGGESAVSALHFAANSPKFLAAVQSITGCDDLTWFGGRIFRMSPDAGHYDSWHDDVAGNRRVGMSINLSDVGYDGGTLELREFASMTMLAQLTNTELGSATLFRISPVLQHRVSPITGTRSRTAFAGWFCSGEPDFLNCLQKTAV